MIPKSNNQKRIWNGTKGGIVLKPLCKGISEMESFNRHVKDDSINDLLDSMQHLTQVSLYDLNINKTIESSRVHDLGTIFDEDSQNQKRREPAKYRLGFTKRETINAEFYSKYVKMENERSSTKYNTYTNGKNPREFSNGKVSETYQGTFLKDDLINRNNNVGIYLKTALMEKRSNRLEDTHQEISEAESIRMSEREKAKKYIRRKDAKFNQSHAYDLNQIFNRGMAILNCFKEIKTYSIEDVISYTPKKSIDAIRPIDKLRKARNSIKLSEMQARRIADKMNSTKKNSIPRQSLSTLSRVPSEVLEHLHELYESRVMQSERVSIDSNEFNEQWIKRLSTGIEIKSIKNNNSSNRSDNGNHLRETSPLSHKTSVLKKESTKQSASSSVCKKDNFLRPNKTYRTVSDAEIVETCRQANKSMGQAMSLVKREKASSSNKPKKKFNFKNNKSVSDVQQLKHLRMNHPDWTVIPHGKMMHPKRA